MMRGTVARVSTLLMTVGLPHRPLCTGKGGLGMGMPRLPSIEAIMAVSSPQTKAPAPSMTCRSKESLTAEDAVAQDAEPAGVFGSLAHALHGKGVLGAHIDIPFVSADSPAGNDHAFDDAVGIALHDAAVHESAGVALIAVADNVFFAFGLLAGHVPFHAGGEAAAAAAPQARIEHFAAQLLGRHVKNRLSGGEVAAACDIFVRILGVDDAAVFQHIAVLKRGKTVYRPCRGSACHRRGSHTAAAQQPCRP